MSDTTSVDTVDLRTAHDHAEASRIAIASELTTVRTSLRLERATHALPALDEDLSTP